MILIANKDSQRPRKYAVFAGCAQVYGPMLGQHFDIMFHALSQLF